MTRKIASGIFYGVFALVFVIMVGIMVKGLIDQNKDEKNQTARYESMITEGSRTQLTREILEEDHEKYLSDSVKAKKTFLSLLVCFGSVVILFFLLALFNVVMKWVEDGGGSIAIPLATFLVLTFILGGFSFIMLNVIVPRVNGTNPEKEAYYFSELNLVESEKKEEVVETGSGDSRRTETRVSYFLIDDSGKKIEVNKLLFERYTDAGIYYAGQTSRGIIFSLYPGKYFELSEDL